MKALLSLLALSLTATSALATDQAVLKALEPRAGLYELSANDAANPCGHGRFEFGMAARLNVYVPTESTEFQEKGDVMVQVEQFGEEINKWYSLFDRAPFFRINGWSKRHFMPAMGAWVTHKSTFDPASRMLRHSGSISTLGGSSSGVQTIVFDEANRKFVYSYDILTYDALGRLKETQKAGRCEFTRKQ